MSWEYFLLDDVLVILPAGTALGKFKPRREWGKEHYDRSISENLYDIAKSPIFLYGKSQYMG